MTNTTSCQNSKDVKSEEHFGAILFLMHVIFVQITVYSIYSLDSKNNFINAGKVYNIWELET